MYDLQAPARVQAAQLSKLAQLWLLSGNPTAGQVAESVVVDCLLRALPRVHRKAVSMRNPATLADLIEAVELVEAAQARDSGVITGGHLKTNKQAGSFGTTG